MAYPRMITYEEMISEDSIPYLHTVNMTEEDCVEVGVEPIDGSRKCKYCEFIPRHRVCGMLTAVEEIELGVHLGIHHQEEIHKTHPYLFEY